LIIEGFIPREKHISVLVAGVAQQWVPTLGQVVVVPEAVQVVGAGEVPLAHIQIPQKLV
jgi:hypothetical protein